MGIEYIDLMRRLEERLQLPRKTLRGLTRPPTTFGDIFDLLRPCIPDQTVTSQDLWRIIVEETWNVIAPLRTEIEYKTKIHDVLSSL